MKKRILVTGSAGFIGRHLVRSLREDYDVVLADLRIGIDLCDPQAVAELPDVDLIYHLAMVNNTSAFYTQPYTIIQNSVLPLHNILKRYPGVPIVYTSSSETYAGGFALGTAPIPTPETVPLTIDDITNPRWSYASSKILGESQVISAGVEFDTPWRIVRYHNVYGPGQRNHFLPEFIDRCLEGRYELYGHSATRSWCYISDAVAATRRVAESGEDGNIYHIGAENEVSVLEVAQQIMKKLGCEEELTLHPEPKGSVQRRCPDIQKIKQLGYNPQVDVSTGLDQLLEKDYGIISK